MAAVGAGAVSGVDGQLDPDRAGDDIIDHAVRGGVVVVAIETVGADITAIGNVNSVGAGNRRPAFVESLAAGTVTIGAGEFGRIIPIAGGGGGDGMTIVGAAAGRRDIGHGIVDRIVDMGHGRLRRMTLGAGGDEGRVGDVDRVPAGRRTVEMTDSAVVGAAGSPTPLRGDDSGTEAVGVTDSGVTGIGGDTVKGDTGGEIDRGIPVRVADRQGAMAIAAGNGLTEGGRDGGGQM